MRQISLSHIADFILYLKNPLHHTAHKYQDTGQKYKNTEENRKDHIRIDKLTSVIGIVNYIKSSILKFNRDIAVLTSQNFLAHRQQGTKRVNSHNIRNLSAAV